MSAFEQLALGFSTAMTPSNLMFCFIGVFLGTLIGVLPGIGPVTTIALLLPFTFSLPATSAIIMLAGIYYGAQYGGSITSILVNLPGEASSAVTCIDGYAMARQGKAGLALAISALGSFLGGTVGTVVVATLSLPLTHFAASVEATDYVALMVCGLVGALVLAHGSIIKAIGMVLFGLLLGTVGTDVASGTSRFTMGIPELADGIGFVPIALGLFGLAEIIDSLASGKEARVTSQSATGFRIRASDTKRAAASSVRGTLLGCVLGVLPGGGPILASFASYALEKKLSSREAEFGHGAIEGVAGPESANNAAAQTSFVPLLTMGFPSNPVMALLLGAMVVHGIQPGPEVITKQPGLFWGLVVSMWIGNGMLLLLNLPLVGIWVKLLRVPHKVLFPATLVLCCIGVYSLNHSSFELMVTAAFGLLGYFFRRAECEVAPLLLGFVLSQPLEENFHRAMVFSNGDATTFLKHPLSATLIAIAVLLIAIATLPHIRQQSKPSGLRFEI